MAQRVVAATMMMMMTMVLAEAHLLATELQEPQAPHQDIDIVVMDDLVILEMEVPEEAHQQAEFSAQLEFDPLMRPKLLCFDNGLAPP